jgi:AraC-like DNA-binding protein
MVNLLNTLLAGSSFLLCILVLSNPLNVNKKANWWFGAFLFCISLLLNETELGLLCSPVIITYFQKFINVACFIIPSLFYFSIIYFVKPNRSWRKQDFVLFIFPLLYITLELIPTSQVERKEALSYSYYLSIAFILLFVIQIIFCCTYSFLLLKKHEQQIKFVNSNLENVDLKWLKKLVYGIILLLLLWCVDLLLTNGSASVYLLFINLVGMVVIGYYALKQKEIYPIALHQKEELDKVFEETDLPLSERKKTIENDELDMLKANLLQLFIDKKWYLDPELSLIKLATEMNLSLKEISYVINTGFNENFYQFVNQFRIEEAKKMMIDPAQNHLNLVGIAFEVGFNSKSVFNATFKKITGLTPTEFKNAAKTRSNTSESMH